MNTKKLITNLFYIPRSLAGPGNRRTLKILSNFCNNKIRVKSFKSNTKFDNWKIPQEWIVKKAIILDKNKNRVIDYNRNNLELVVNSDSFKGYISKKELIKKIFTLKDNPNAIPYVTNYYSKNFWGVCMKYKDVQKLEDNKYFVEIDTKKKKWKNELW